jgi:hypothetical protein
MRQLTAVFSISLSSSLFYTGEETESISHSLKLGDFAVEARLIVGDRITKFKDDSHWTRLISEIEIRVTRDEDEEPPPDWHVTEDGLKHYAGPLPYFDDRREEFKVPAVELLNRVLSYFKFQLHQPFVEDFDESDYRFRNPNWYDEAGELIKKGHRELTLQSVPGITEWEHVALKLNADSLSEFKAAVDTGYTASLQEEFLSKAQADIFRQNLRRGALQTAIACEIAVKQRFFGASSEASATWEYLEDKGRVRVSVTELVSKVSSHVFGRSLRDEDPDAFEKIDNLFRCRNKIVHRGIAAYRTDDGVEHAASLDSLKEWWEAALRLLTWFESL